MDIIIGEIVTTSKTGRKATVRMTVIFRKGTANIKKELLSNVVRK